MHKQWPDIAAELNPLVAKLRATQPDVLNSWTQVSTAAMPKRFITNISIDPRNAARAWVSFGGFESSNIWFTGDGGHEAWANFIKTVKP